MAAIERIERPILKDPTLQSTTAESEPPRVETAVAPSLRAIGQPDANKPAKQLRPDIQALRAVAVGAVVLFHLWPDRLRGGFVGVDIFFVISGFLITSHLLAELFHTGGVRLGHFWAKRAKRLLPASLLVLVVVAVLVATIVPVSERAGWMQQIAAATVYGQNWALAAQAVDYMHAADAPSPVQHFWSLSVEEQFYIALPLMLVLLAMVLTPLGRDRRQRLLPRLVPVVLGLVVLGSLAFSVHLSRADVAVAYFHTGTRAWEFAAGGLLACCATSGRRIVRLILGWTGAVLVLGAVIAMPGDTTGWWAFPGWVAAVPVVGTMMIIAASGEGPLGLAARLRPVTFVGDVSYSVYLWHWPLIVLLPFVLGHDLTNLEKILICLATLVLAWMSAKLIEDPVRFLPTRTRRDIVITAVAVAVAMVLIAGSSVGLARGSAAEVERLKAVARISTDDLAGCIGAAVQADDVSGCERVPRRMFPSVNAVAEDEYNDMRCWSDWDESVPRVCRLPGARGADPLRVLAIGDSHSNMYLAAYEEIARIQGWSMDVTARAHCAWSDRKQISGDAERQERCTTWKDDITRQIADGEPYDVIITTARRGDGTLVPRKGETRREAAVNGVTDLWEGEIARGTVVVALKDVPNMGGNVMTCLKRHGLRAAKACAIDRKKAFSGFDPLTVAVRKTPASALVDLTDLYCDPRVCRPVIGNVGAYRDSNHVTATYIRTLVPYLRVRVLAAVDRARQDRS